MGWILLVIATALLVVPFVSQSVGWALLALLLGLGFLVAGILMLASARIAARSRHEAQMLSAEDLQKMREAAERRRAEAAAAQPPVEPPEPPDDRQG